MKVVTFASFKGGAGKTTALMAACSSLVRRGFRVALFEADPNAPLTRWRADGRDYGTWDDGCEIYPADRLETFGASFEAAETAGCDIAMIDTQGGGSELNNTILVNSSVVVVPTSLSPLDIDAAVDTVEYAAKLFLNEREDIPTAILLSRVPVGRLTNSMEADVKLLESLPQFDTWLYERDAFRSIKSRGMLHLLHDKVAATPAQRISARHIGKALEEADSFAADLLDAVGEGAHAG